MEFSKEELIELIDAFNSKIDNYQKEFNDFKTQFNDFLDKAESNYKDWDHTTRLGEFKERYKDSIDPIAEDVKREQGEDDFDLGTRLFDDYEASDKSVAEDEYVANVVASLTEQLNKLKEVTGAEEVKVETKPIPKSKIKPKKDEEVNTKKKNDTSSTSKSNDSKKVDSKKKEEVKKKKNNRKIDDEDSVIESLW